MTIYRATADENETALAFGMCFCESREDAEEYTENQGFGGEHIREHEIAGAETILDIADSSTVKQFRALAEALGYEDAQEAAESWHANGWLYPWEESRKVSEQLKASGYDWLRYEDDYPEDCITLMRIS